MRGDVYKLKSDRQARGHEQGGPRYAVVIQADELDILSTWLVAPTSTKPRPSGFRPEIDLGGIRTRVMVEHTVSVDVELRLGDHVGRVSYPEMQEIDNALRMVLGLD